MVNNIDNDRIACVDVLGYMPGRLSVLKLTIIGSFSRATVIMRHIDFI